MSAKERIKVGEYFRAYGKIDKVKSIVRRSSLYEDSGIYGEQYGKFTMGSKVIDEVPHSFNVIDLIEVGDYVNGYKISYIDNCKGCMRQFYYEYEDLNIDCGHWDEEIKSIVTKEQFKKYSYKVGE